MSMETIRRQYGVPAKRGGRILYIDDDGTKWYCTIKSSRDGYLRVLADDRIRGYKGRMLLHPTWNVQYLPPTTRKLEWYKGNEGINP